MFPLEVGQVLLTTTDEKATIIEMTDSTISVYYNGNVHTRSKSIIGEKLFVTNEDKKKFEMKEQIEAREKKKKREHEKWLDEMKKPDVDNDKREKFDEDRNRQGSSGYYEIKTCKTCMLLRSGDCFGRKIICKYYKEVPVMKYNW